MVELIKISENKTVSARELHSWLGVKERFSAWMDRQFQYGFVSGIDYTGCKVFNALAKQELDDFALTIDCAKEISMLQKSDKGKEARLYFIAVEKKMLQPMSIEQMIIAQAQSVIDLKAQTKLLEERILKIENAPVQNAEIRHFSIMGHCRNIGKQISLSEAKKYGAKCRALSNQMGFVMGKIPDPRFGSVNTYALDVLNEIIK